MAELEGAVLIGSGVCDKYSKINLIHSEKKNGIWTVCDKSSYGTYLNSERLKKDKPATIKNGDEVAFGPGSNFKYIFYAEDISTNPYKKMRLDGDATLEEQKLQNEKQVSELKIKKHIEKREMREKREVQDRLQSGNTEQGKVLEEELKLGQQQSEERRISQEKLLQEKCLLEEKLKEMQNLLEEKDKAQEVLYKQLQEKEEQRLRDLKQLQEQKDAQTKVLLEELRKEVAEKEEVIKIQLAREIQILQEEKFKIENDIRGELSKKEGESAENLKRLQEELQKVKTDLSNTEGKKQYLEQELENITKAKEDASESCLRAKQDVLANFGELIETELQCSICSELFVTATTLNCTHTFCHSCIVEWKKKKKDCPVCRTHITSQNRSIVLDNFIDRMVENLSVEMKNRRQEIVEERQIQELLGPKSKPEPSHEPQRWRRRRRNAISSDSWEDYSQNNSEVIYISSTGSSDTESEASSLYNSEYLSDESYVEGDPNAYYGGYGYCYRCGRRGHWARGCPDC